MKNWEEKRETPKNHIHELSLVHYRILGRNSNRDQKEKHLKTRFKELFWVIVIWGKMWSLVVSPCPCPQALSPSA
jgi:hypothetical protein